MKRTTPELLAPAGGRSQLETAVRFGADAVYLASDRFGMRQRAENFQLEDIPSAVEFAHEADVQVFVTLNTLMSGDDIAMLPPYLEALQDAKVDAFIVGDLGAFRTAQKYAPHVALHVSTQASVANAEAARVWHELGASRVVCAREMSLEGIAEMCAAAPKDLEFEAFVHGAMCMAVSGRCLISSVMTGRSGNRGFCTQPCRWSFSLVEEKRPGQYYPIEQDIRGSYLMNAEDMNMLDHLDELAKAGITSFKIEGRNKRSFYVASVVHAYRSVLDGADPSALQPELMAISHRPYGTGFYFDEPTQSHGQDGYIKECLHVASVLSCEEGDDGHCYVQVKCFNRFSEGGELEVLSPRQDVKKITVKDLVRLPKPGESYTQPDPIPTAVANRASETYGFYAEQAVMPGDFLRCRIEPASENEGTPN